MWFVAKTLKSYQDTQPGGSTSVLTTREGSEDWKEEKGIRGKGSKNSGSAEVRL